VGIYLEDPRKYQEDFSASVKSSVCAMMGTRKKHGKGECNTSAGW